MNHNFFDSAPCYQVISVTVNLVHDSSTFQLLGLEGSKADVLDTTANLLMLFYNVSKA